MGVTVSPYCCRSVLCANLIRFAVCFVLTLASKGVCCCRRSSFIWLRVNVICAPLSLPLPLTPSLIQKLAREANRCQFWLHILCHSRATRSLIVF